MSYFLGLPARWLFSALIFIALGLLQFIVPWYLPQASLSEVLFHSTWGLAWKSCPLPELGVTLPTSFFSHLEAPHPAAPPSLTLLARTILGCRHNLR